jgi:hypothetical protein
MTTQVILALLAIKLAMAAGAALLIRALLRLDTTDERQGGGGGGGGGPRLKPGPRRRGPHGGVMPPAPARVRARRGRRVRQRV